MLATRSGLSCFSVVEIFSFQVAEQRYAPLQTCSIGNELVTNLFDPRLTLKLQIGLENQGHGDPNDPFPQQARG